jgi:hypothetical protein
MTPPRRHPARSPTLSQRANLSCLQGQTEAPAPDDVQVPRALDVRLPLRQGMQACGGHGTTRSSAASVSRAPNHTPAFVRSERPSLGQVTSLDVGSPDFGRRSVAVEAFAHEQHDGFLAGEHVDQFELDPAVAVAVADRLDVAARGCFALVIARERSAPGDVNYDFLDEAEGGVLVAALGRCEVVGDELTRGHDLHRTSARGRLFRRTRLARKPAE